MAKVKRLKRRSFLRGMGGVAVSLPLLEIMGLPGEILGVSKVRADGHLSPKRFVLMFGGVSTGADRGPEDMLLVPDTVGRGYDIKRALQPLADLDVRDDVSVVTGLKIPWQTGTDPIPPGGRTVFYHYNTVGPQAAGTHAGSYSGGTEDRGEREGRPKGPTCDQLVADAISGDTIHRVLTYRVQPASYVGRNEIGGKSGQLSWRQDDSGLHGVNPIVSPRLAYESLFSGFTPADPEAAVRARYELRRRRSVLDFVRGDAERLMSRLGRSDRLRMEQHFEEIRALERRLDQIPEVQGVCQVPEHPGDDPAIGGAINEYNGAGQEYSTSEGYSGEDDRADLMASFIRMAFACDLSRVASFMLTEWKCYMNMYQIAGHEGDMHDFTHFPRQEAVSDAVAWHVKQLARLTSMLKDTPQVDGTTLLDHSALVLIFEGGLGYDPEGENDNSSHSTERMVTLIAGRSGGLQPGQHVPTNEAHPAQVVISAMNAVGVEGGLGEVRGHIPELFG